MAKKTGTASSKSAAKAKCAKATGKQATKATSLKDATLTKGTKKLNKKDLASLGKLSLSEKLAKVAEQVDNDDDAAEALKKQLTPVQNSQVWNQHKQHLLRNPEEAAKLEGLSKKEKGNAAALGFLMKSKPKYLRLGMHCDFDETVTKVDKWMSHKECEDRFGTEDMSRHINSGRLLWRECQFTKGTWEYKDQGLSFRETKFTRGKNLELGQDYEADEDHENWFAELFTKDMDNMVSDNMWSTKYLEKGSGKGQSLTKGKGKGKGGEPPAPPVPKSEEDMLEEAYSKTRKMRDLCTSTVANMEESVLMVKKSKFWSKAAQKDAQSYIEGLSNEIVNLKKMLLKKNVSYDELKEASMQAAAVVKECQAYVKEWQQLANKASSKASSSSRK